MRYPRSMSLLAISLIFLAPAAAVADSVYIPQIERGKAASSKSGSTPKATAASAGGTSRQTSGPGAEVVIVDPKEQDLVTHPDMPIVILPPGGQAAGLAPSANSARTEQRGNANTAHIIQTGYGLEALSIIAGANNATTQSQQGNNSTSTIDVLGQWNSISVDQRGDSNTSVLGAIGDRNNIQHVQNGTGLSFGINVIGNDRAITIEQSGVGRGAAVHHNTSGLPAAAGQ